jgi:hypothetical protein
VDECATRGTVRQVHVGQGRSERRGASKGGNGAACDPERVEWDLGNPYGNGPWSCFYPVI